VIISEVLVNQPEKQIHGGNLKPTDAVTLGQVTVVLSQAISWQGPQSR
jgi:hypothetical protein